MPSVQATSWGVAANPVTSVSTTVTVSGTDRALVAVVALNNSALESVSGVTAGGVPMTLLGAERTGDDGRIEWWWLQDPAEGSTQVVATMSAAGVASRLLSVGAWALSSVSAVRAVQFDGQQTPQTRLVSRTVTVATEPDDLVLVTGFCEGGNQAWMNSVFDAGVSVDWVATIGSSLDRATGGHIDATGSTASATLSIDAAQIDYLLVSALSLTPSTVTTGPNTPVLVRSWAGIPAGGEYAATCKTTDASSVRLVVATDSALTTGQVFSTGSVPDSDGWARCDVTGLAAGTYWYGWELEDTEGTPTVTAAQGSFRVGMQSFTIGFGSCMASGSTANTLTRLAARAPDMFFHTGDLAYPDNSSTSQASHLADLEAQLAANAGLRDLVASTPSLYLRSDHDAGGGNNAMPGPYTAPNRAAYKQVVPHRPLVDPDGLYYAFTVGRVRFIVTDQRYLRTGTSMLGAAQMAWFLDELTGPEPVKVWVQDSTYITDVAPSGADKWSDYEDDRDAIAAHIAANAAQVGQVITLHGDQHALAADDGTNNDWGGFPSWAAAPFDNAPSQKASTWSEGIYPTGGGQVQQYGFVEVTDDGETLTLAFTGYDSSDQSQITDTVQVTTTTAPTPWRTWSAGQLVPVDFLGRYVGGQVEAGELFLSSTTADGAGYANTYTDTY